MAARSASEVEVKQAAARAAKRGKKQEQQQESDGSEEDEEDGSDGGCRGCVDLHVMHMLVPGNALGCGAACEQLMHPAHTALHRPAAGIAAP